MKKSEAKLTVIWEEVTVPDAQERLASAFAMLLSPRSSSNPPEMELDS